MPRVWRRFLHEVNRNSASISDGEKLNLECIFIQFFLFNLSQKRGFFRFFDRNFSEFLVTHFWIFLQSCCRDCFKNSSTFWLFENLIFSYFKNKLKIWGFSVIFTYDVKDNIHCSREYLCFLFYTECFSLKKRKEFLRKNLIFGEMEAFS